MATRMLFKKVSKNVQCTKCNMDTNLLGQTKCCQKKCYRTDMVYTYQLTEKNSHLDMITHQLTEDSVRLSFLIMHTQKTIND